jgi:AcrR family transcriptional regulator
MSGDAITFDKMSDQMSEKATTAPPASGRRYRDKSADERRRDRHEKLLEAAVEAFGTDGYAATSIEQLCASAGISTRNFYEEFSSREELLVALHDDLNARALQAVLEAIADVDPNDLEARANAGVRAYFTVMTTDRRWAKIALVESVGVSPEAEAHRRAAIDRFAEVLRLEAARLAGLGLVPERDYRLTATALVGAVEGLINTWTSDEDWAAHVEQVIAEAVRLIVRAIRD